MLAGETRLMNDEAACVRTVGQTGSHIGRTEDQRGTLIGLGLNKRHRSRELIDTPEVRGMIKKVRHLVRIDEEAT